MTQLTVTVTKMSLCLVSLKAPTTNRRCKLTLRFHFMERKFPDNYALMMFPAIQMKEERALTCNVGRRHKHRGVIVDVQNCYSDEPDTEEFLGGLSVVMYFDCHLKSNQILNYLYVRDSCVCFWTLSPPRERLVHLLLDSLTST